ncbi:MAG: tail fiber domain-containing protein [Reyranella sp.]|uniref:tail fiber domain-containing protein n=1 Tax=Reyranella sp. TaxID=1929291 RepID=UPI0025EFC7B6|nr:tail fiber domain-containing protein [Reyranella sp.]MBR2818225.1 tail fiber domain-containing protein [Reyranella sp.]
MGKSMQPTGTTESKQETKLPENISSAGSTNMTAAYNVAQNMLGPYKGATYAGLTPGAYANIAGLQSLVGSSTPAYNLAQNTMGGLTNFAAPTINAPTLAQTDLSAYMNPYTSSVIQSGLQGIDMQRRQALNSNADQAIAQKAFGGSRQGVQEGITNSAASMQAGQLASQLANQGYQQAQQAAQFDIANNLGTQQANAANKMNAAGLNMSAANGLAGVAQQGQSSNLQALMAALQGQTLAQQDQQGRLNADQAAYAAAQQFPLQQLQIPISALSATPYGSTTTGTQTQSAPGSGAMQGIGAAANVIGILGSLFSDRDAKTDIKKLGTDSETGLDMYAYRYKGDPKSYPKVVGPMAQDVEKKYPGSTRRVNGHLAIKKSML